MTEPTSGATSFRLLHTMIRVLNLTHSVEFYCGKLGMTLLRKIDFPGGRFTLAFVGYGSESDHTVIELTHNWDQPGPYETGNSWGHIAIGVKDIYGLCERLERQGVTISRAPGPMQHGTTVIAFIEDPDGRKIELIQD